MSLRRILAKVLAVSTFTAVVGSALSLGMAELQRGRHWPAPAQAPQSWGTKALSAVQASIVDMVAVADEPSPVLLAGFNATPAPSVSR
jgi:hypothetical protein